MECFLSIVIPVYNEQESIPRLYEALGSSIKDCISKGLVSDYEIWFVNDGSTDNSEDVIKEIIMFDCRVKMIIFRKNFGKAMALQSGFYHCHGDIIITMDADLQDDPKIIPKFIEKINEGFDLVSGWKYHRMDPLEKRIMSKVFNKVTSSFSGIKLHDFNCGFKAYRRDVVKNIDVYGELHRFIPVLAYRKGYRIAEIIVTHHKRKFGKSKYSFERYLRGLFDALTTSFLLRYYDKPMYFFGRIGFSSLMVGMFICIFLSVQWLLGNSIGDRPLLLLGVLCIILGVQSISTGFIADLIVDVSYRGRYNEGHVKEVISFSSLDYSDRGE